MCIFAQSAPSSVSAQDIPLLTDPDFQDIPEEEGLIAAPDWLVGLHFQSAQAERRPTVLTFVPAIGPTEVVCLEATTIDGRFAAKGQYATSKSMQGWIELAYTTSFANVWSNASVDNSGVVASSGPCGDAATPATVLYPAVLNGGLADVARDGVGNSTLVLNMHARKTSEIEASMTLNAVKLPVSCHKLDRSDAIKFNFTCTVSVPKGANGEATFRYTRLYKGRSRPGETGRIFLPALK